MYQITKEETEELLQEMRQIRQASGKMISFLEHMMQLQTEEPLKQVNYNPDDYLEAHTRAFGLARQKLSKENSGEELVDDF